MILVQMKLTDLVLDPRCQMRVEFSEEYAGQLADYLEAGGHLPPLVAFRERPGPAILADGWHRRRAHEIARRRTAEVDVRAGGMREAILYAVGCNSRHGLRPKPEDLRKAVASLLVDPEWGKWASREIARRVGCGYNLVCRLREQLEQLSVTRGQIEADGVKVERGGTTYTMRFRDMTPAQQRAAVEEETDRHRPAWEREGREALETAERCYAQLGEEWAGVLAGVRQGLDGVKAIEKAREKARKGEAA